VQRRRLSTPSVSCGRRPTSQPPTRTISSQLPTPAARTEIRPRDAGVASSSRCTSPPTASIPAACIGRGATTLGILEPTRTRGCFEDPTPDSGDVLALPVNPGGLLAHAG
jgi:hypothetical protein